MGKRERGKMGMEEARVRVGRGTLSGEDASSS